MALASTLVAPGNMAVGPRPAWPARASAARSPEAIPVQAGPRVLLLIVSLALLLGLGPRPTVAQPNPHAASDPWAHAHVPIVVLSLMTLAIPVFAAASAALFISEPVTVVQVAGMAVVISSLAVVVTRTSRHVPEAAESPGTPAVELA